MIKALIKYTGKRTGFMAQYYFDFKELGRYKTEEEASEAYTNWVNLTKSNDWELKLSS